MARSPIRDPYYRKILEGLEGHLDPVLFENVAIRLLRRVLPGIASLPGGSDHGRDGLIPDWEGEPYPAIVTIGDALANLKGSLERYAKIPQHRDRVVFATARALTPGQVDSLFEVARKKGFRLLAPYQQQDFADWLYRDPQTCRELLGLCGKPAALSSVPQSWPAHVAVPLVGRAKDLEWLRTTPGDRVLVGQPGSGKTFLLRELVSEDGGLFLVSDDEAAVANDLREKYGGSGAGLVFVDDAHAYPSRIVLLRRLREDMGASFDIVATTWPGNRADVQEAMAGAPARTLELMPRDDLVLLYRSLGIPESLDVDIVRELVDQASNRPGLAATLADACLRGQWEEVLKGEALAKHIRVDLKRHLGFDPTALLATVALSGSRGISVELVAGVLGRPQADVWGELVMIGQTGFLDDVGGRQALQPRRLRGVLVRDVFLPDSGPSLRPYRSIVEMLSDGQPIPGRASDRGAAVEVLLEARMAGGKISDEEIRRLVESSASTRSWQILAHLGEGNARWALARFPGPEEEIVGQALRTAPEAAIRFVLERASREEGEPVGSLYHRPLPVVADWVQDLDAKGQWVRRRRAVAAGAISWWRETENLEIALEAVQIALSPRLHTSKVDPGIGMAVTFSMAVLQEADVAEMDSVWRAVAPVFEPLTPPAWRTLRSVLEDWMQPEALAPGLSAGGAASARDFARRILQDVVPQLAGHPALATDAQRLASRLGLTLDVVTDPLLDVLFPPAFTMANVASLQALAAQWVREPPAAVAKRVAAYEASAMQIGRTSGLAVYELGKALAESVADPVSWTEALLNAGLRVEMVGPFLPRLLHPSTQVGLGLLERALGEPRLRTWAAMVVLQAEQPSAGLLDRAIALVETQPDLVETACLRNELPLETAERILHSPDFEIRTAALTGVWNANPQGEVPSYLRPAWEQAALQTNPTAFQRSQALRYWFPEILKSSPGLAERWLEKHATDLQSDLGSVVLAAVEAISPEARSRLVGSLPGAAAYVLDSLVRADPEGLYELFLRRYPRPENPLSPLWHFKWRPDDPRWRQLADLAVVAGQAPHQVARFVLAPFPTVGSGIEHWRSWEDAFQALEGSAGQPLREVASEGRKLAAMHRVESEKQQHDRALRGIHGSD